MDQTNRSEVAERKNAGGEPGDSARQIEEARVRKIAARVFKCIYTELIAARIADTDILFLVSKDAADAAGKALLRDLPINGIEVTR